ncbi:UPF0213 protein [Philodulcilactobacillus myokoensis]|uniref:UPF0213 protein n=1 Tax=Philodulcilactobacillus myokoensis TaxID=2929573 RepID=A0A9W6ET30_9LACO|nr:GIY-YIG nuclease family protein [Philodulcilactobacillus myokoensis]GLB46958.1 UPF0213 protein [Philodulcilactobacillus myokoensis]
MASKFYVYVLLCNDGSLYCGFSTDVIQRFKRHQAGKGAKYTRSHPPLMILYDWEYKTKGMALHKEWEFKRLNRHQKLMKLKSSGVQIEKILTKYGLN